MTTWGGYARVMGHPERPWPVGTKRLRQTLTDAYVVEDTIDAFVFEALLDRALALGVLDRAVPMVDGLRSVLNVLWPEMRLGLGGGAYRVVKAPERVAIERLIGPAALGRRSCRDDEPMFPLPKMDRLP